MFFSENDINIKVAVRYNQDVNAYSGTNRTASGKVPEVGYASVHWVGSNRQNPIISFGTYIYIDSNKELPWRNHLSPREFFVLFGWEIYEIL